MSSDLSPKQVASDEQMKVAKDIFGGCTCDLLEGFAWSGKHKRDCVILVVATAISKAVEDEREAIANLADAFDHGDHRYESVNVCCGALVANAIRARGSKKEDGKRSKGIAGTISPTKWAKP